MAKQGFTRRGFLQGAASAAGLIGASRLAGSRLIRSAHAAEGDEQPALFILYMRGGYNALFPSADSFLGNGAFGVASGNVRRIRQSDVYVDRGSLGSLPDEVLDHYASIGVRHGLSAHPAAQSALWMNGNQSYPLQLASSLGGTAAIRAAAIGDMPPGTHRAVDGVSLQLVRDLQTTIAALGGTTDANAPTREIVAGGIASSHLMSQRALLTNPRSSASFAEGYPAAVGMLTQEDVALDYAEMAEAYGIRPNASGIYPTAVRNNMRMRLLGAELMIRAGANVVVTQSRGWDSHGDRNGNEVRTKMENARINEALRTFTRRTQAMTGRNVVTAIFGDFSRSLPGSDHQANLTASVMGKYVKLGTTGRVNRNVQLPNGTPGIRGLWAYMHAALKGPGQPFGNDPHGLIL